MCVPSRPSMCHPRVLFLFFCVSCLPACESKLDVKASSPGSAVTTAPTTPPSRLSAAFRLQNDIEATRHLQVALELLDPSGVALWHSATIDGAKAACPEGLSLTDWAPASVSPSAELPAGDGVKTICLFVRDASGQFTDSASNGILLDQTAPTVTLELADEIGSEIPQGSNVIVSGIATDDSTGVSRVEVSLSAQNGKCLGLEAKAFNEPCPLWLQAEVHDGSWTVAIPDSRFAHGQTYELSVQATDAVGNVSRPITKAFVWDRPSPVATQPVFTALIAINEASDHYVNAAEAASSKPLFELKASNYTLAEYTALMVATPTLTCDGSLTYDQTTIPTIDMLPADDAYVVCARLSDDYGNVTYGQSDIVTRDTVARCSTA